MPKLILTQGLPASGKTTWAEKWVNEDPEHRALISRDDLRDMQRQPYSVHREKVVTLIQVGAVAKLLRTGYDVVIDDAHLNQRSLKRWQDLARYIPDVDLIINRDFLKVSVEECINRDQTPERIESGKAAGPSVIKRMATTYLKNRETA